MPLGSVPTLTFGSVGSGVDAVGAAEAVVWGFACCAPTATSGRPASETSAAVIERIEWWVLGMVECYPVEVFSLPQWIYRTRPLL